MPLYQDDEQTVDEVDHPEGERRRDERHAEGLHPAEERAVELEPELLAAVGEEAEVHGERADEVADEEPDCAPVKDRDEDDHRCDGERDVRDARDRVGRRALFDAEERRQLLVVRLRPEADGAGAHEHGLVAQAEQMADRARERDDEHEPERRHRHREPERRADDRQLLGSFLRIEVEAEERAGDPHLQDDREHRGGGGDDLHLAVGAGRQEVRVERQQQGREDPRDEAADAVDR